MADDLRRLHRLGLVKSRAAQARLARAQAKEAEAEEARASGQKALQALGRRQSLAQRARIDDMIGKPASAAMLQQLALGHAVGVEEHNAESARVAILAMQHAEAALATARSGLEAKSHERRHVKLEKAVELETARARTHADMLQDFESER